MNIIRRRLSILAFIAVLLSACQPESTPMPVETPTLAATEVDASPTPEPTEEEPVEVQEDILYLNILWHQHQPLYYKDENGVYTRPWVRVHATKDYFDMASILKEYPDIHASFNLTPVLIRQLDDFTENGAKDIYWELSEVPADQLTEDQQRFILTRFFDVNWDNILARFPRYQELLNLRGQAADEDSISAALEQFTVQDYRDLQIWFNLAWFDPIFLEAEPLQSLVEKGSGFEEAEKAVVFNQVREVMADVIPVHRELQEAGQIEVITTPYAHPILPLIYDTNLALVGNPGAEMPPRFSWPNDAIAHLELSVEMYQNHFGREPRGLWPGEGAVADPIVPLVSRSGYEWMATGEPVLAESIGIGSFQRDALETVQEADDLYRPYWVEVEGSRIAVFFRDWRMSDLLGFEYSNQPGEAAAQDLMNRLENIRERLDEQGVEGPHLVSLILDGENAWEYYDHDGKEFLHNMYQMLSESETIQTVTPSEYLEMFPEQRDLETLFPGAWFSPNYDTWIGETEERLAWEYLGQVRDYLSKYDLTGRRTPPSPEALAAAQDYMYLAEGSDWFWWFGDDQDSGQDEYFDEGFRALLARVYESLGDPVPDFVHVPIIPLPPVSPNRSMQGLSSPTIDGRAAPDEWENAAQYMGAAAELNLGIDADNLYVRIESEEGFDASDPIGIYVTAPNQETVSPFARSLTEDDEKLILGISATHLFEWNGEELTFYQPIDGGWQPAGTAGNGAAGEGGIEIAVPLDELGALTPGSDLQILILQYSEDVFIPAAGPAQVVIPDLGLSTTILQVQDPPNDDWGPGTYTYPTDPVFGEQDFDLQSFSVGYDDSDLIFNFTFYGAIPNPWGSPNNLAIQTLDVYIDTDPGEDTGARLLLPGRNAAISDENGWDIAIFAEGWYPEVFQADPATGETTIVNTDLRIIVDPAAQSVTVRVPLQVFGDGDPEEWGYVGAVLSQEGFPSTGVLRVRDITPAGGQWVWGGGPGDTNYTRIIDLAWPEGQSPTQEEQLGNYPSSQSPVSELTPDDFTQVELLRP